MARQESISNEFQHQLIDDLIHFMVIVQVLRDYFYYYTKRLFINKQAALYHNNCKYKNKKKITYNNRKEKQ